MKVGIKDFFFYEGLEKKNGEKKIPFFGFIGAGERIRVYKLWVSFFIF